jgi:hypothetical protein
MNIDEFLRLGGAEMSTVIAEVNATVGLGARDVLLAVGSLVEGMGTSKSDLDLLLITSRSESSLHSLDHVPVIVGRCLVDVQIMPLIEFEELLTRFAIWSELPWNVTHAVKFTLDERNLLHRLLHGRVLHKGKSESVTTRIPRLEDLARLKLHVARQASRTIQVDMVGHRESRDYRTLVFAAQELLGHATDALLAGYQLTNPLVKWRSRMLDSVPSDWERRLSIRPTGLRARERAWRLHRAPEKPDEKPALEHALRITTFSRAVFMWAELRLVKRSTRKRTSVVWSRIQGKPHDCPLPYLDFDVDFFLGEDRVTIARLNEFDETVDISQREFDLILLFDGTTTGREAEHVINGARRGKVGSNVVDELVSRINRAGLCFSPSRRKSSDENGPKSLSSRSSGKP